jgi:hypothetical protein
MDDSVAADLEGSEFWPYCDEVLPQRRSFFCLGRHLTPAEILSFSPTMQGTIMKLPGELTDLAVKNFKRKSSKIQQNFYLNRNDFHDD